MASLIPPVGYAAVVTMFGNAHDPHFEAKHIISLPIPYPLIYVNDLGTRHVVKTIRVHRLLSGIFTDCFQAILDNKLESLCGYYGGGYNYRPIRGSTTRLSTHAFGVAIDLNPATNRLGTVGNMDARIVTILTDRGLTWGGTFTRLDPMHFQFCLGM